MTVDKFYEVGIKLGGKSEAIPGEKSGRYYSYLRNLDENKISTFTDI